MNWSEVVDAAVTTVFDGPLLAAGLVAVAAGLVSFASPCVLPLLPGYLGYLGGMVGAAGTAGRGARGGTTRRGGSRTSTRTATRTSTRTPTRTSTRTRPAGSRRRLLLGVALFIAGFSAVFVGLGVVFAMAGLRLAAYTDVILRVAGVLVILLGLAFTGLVPFLQRERRLHVDPRSAGLWGAPLLGVTFGLGWTPCIGPTLAAVLTLAFGGGDPGRGALLAALDGLGLGGPVVLLALALDRSAAVVGWLGRHARTVQVIGGVLLVALGLALVTGVWGAIVDRLAVSIAGFETLL